MNKRTVLILGLCFVLFMLWYPLMGWLGWLPPAKRPAQAPAVAPQTPEQPAVPLPPPAEGVPAVGPAPAPDSWPAAERALPPAHTAGLGGAGQTRFTVDTVNGGVTGVELSRFIRYDKAGAVSLGDYRFPFCSLELPAALAPTAGVEATGGAEADVGGPDGVVVSRAFADGQGEVRESWRLDPAEPYGLVYEIRLSNSGDRPLRLDGLQVVCGGLTSERVGKDPKLARIGAVDLGFEVARDWKERPLSLNVRRIGKLSGGGTTWRAAAPVAWVAVHNKYFLMYLTPEKEEGVFAGVDVGVSKVGGEGDVPAEWLHGRCRLAPVEVAPGVPTVLRFRGFVGPKEHRRLRTLGPNVDAVMGLDLFLFPGWRTGWMGAISKAILYSLTWLAEHFGGAWRYGYAIIVVTIVIKLLFWPLTHSSTVSMRRMQKLQPLVQEIKAKYKDDPATMNRKVWELHREHKANPLGGCLPILLQIPIFFALFNTLRGAIELRQASFLWVSDLSVPDTIFSLAGLPIRPLAILMGGTMVLQQHLSPGGGDPTQKRMMMFMSVFFLFMFYGMPAGLNLYWSVNQILTIGQTLFTQYLEKRSEQRQSNAGKAEPESRPARR